MLITDKCTCPRCNYVSLNPFNPHPLQAITDAPPTQPVDHSEAILAADLKLFGPSRYNSPRRIIAFTGLAGSGKSTAAMHLVSQGWTRVRFAGPLKAMMAALGLSQEQIEGSEKEVPCDLLCGQTPRFAMQTIGTEWGRDIIGSDLWIRAWQAALAKVPGNVAVDDCRFPNEADAIRAAGGHIVRVVRPGAGAGAAGHSSEGYDIQPHYWIENSGTVDAFLIDVDDAVRDLSWMEK